jgi:hypothetical protein
MFGLFSSCWPGAKASEERPLLNKSSSTLFKMQYLHYKEMLAILVKISSFSSRTPESNELLAKLGQAKEDGMPMEEREFFINFNRGLCEIGQLHRRALRRNEEDLAARLSNLYDQLIKMSTNNSNLEDDKKALAKVFQELIPIRPLLPKKVKPASADFTSHNQEHHVRSSP